ncbi:MAG: diguanylate cyclase [Cellvibrionaceae bacterium]
MKLSNQNNELHEFHWLLDVLQNIGAGLVVMDRNYKITLWNGFMQNHSALMPTEVMGKTIFSLFPELPEKWFKRKAQSVFMLHNSAFTTWEQRPYLFRFKNYRPITGRAEFMYQNCTIMPLIGLQHEVDHICLIVYDVTDTAVNKLSLQEANSQLEHLSRTDRLTGLFNRGWWEECLISEYKRFSRSNANCSLVMFDIDHFKKVNDTFGHQAGDEVIRKTAETVRKTIRDVDIAGRYGGEEFTIILYNSDKDGCQSFAERLRKMIEGLTVIYDKTEIKFTISLGLATLTLDIESPADWIEAADKALYEAKEDGRNCWKVFGG